MTNKKKVAKKNKNIIPDTPIVMSVEEQMKLNKKLGIILADIEISGLTGHVEICYDGSVPTAVWIYNKKTKVFSIKIGANLVKTLEPNEIKLVLQHELLHHYKYQNCDTRNNVMSNIVLDVAINKILYLYEPNNMCSLAEKIYFTDKVVEKDGELVKEKTTMQDLSASPVVLACPLLEANDIKNIPDPKIQQAYIDIWGNRETWQNYDTTIPDPTELFFKLIQFIDPDDSINSPFGEDSDGESNEDNESDDSNEQGENSQNNKDSKKGKIRKRCKVIEDNDEDTDEDDNKTIKEGKKDGEKLNSNNNDDDKNPENKDNKNNKDDGEENDKYTQLEDEIKDLNTIIEDDIESKNPGNSSGISICDSVPLELNIKEIEKQLELLRIAETIEEVGHALEEASGGNVEQLPYIVRPTRTTLNHIACGITNYMPMYWNHTSNNIKAKIACYIDVSGSMNNLTSLVQAIIGKATDLLPSVIFAFDTKILPVHSKLFKCRALVGGGTDFDTVLRHINMNVAEKIDWFENLSIRNSNNIMESEVLTDDVQTVFILTDGEDEISQQYIDNFKKSGKKLIVLQILANNQYKNIFTEIADQIIYVNKLGEIIK